MTLAPIILFCYNRPEHTYKTIESLKQNKLAKESILYIFVDGPKSQKDIEKNKSVIELVKSVTGFKEVIIAIQNENKGLANSVITGVTTVIEKHKKVIVLEDDLILAPYFLQFMNEALETYSNNKNIWSVSGYSFPIEIPEYYDKDIYATYRASSWGWGTWENRWKDIDWEIKDYLEFKKDRRAIDNFKQGGDDLPDMLQMQMNKQIDSWAIRWVYNQYKQNKYSILPTVSLVNNIGCDGSGVHCGINKTFDVKLSSQDVIKFDENIYMDLKITKAIRELCSPLKQEEYITIYKQKNEFYWKLLMVVYEQKNISNYIKKLCNSNSITIYGIGDIGKFLIEIIHKEKSINIDGIIDKNETSFLNYKVKTLEEYNNITTKQDIIIVTIFYYKKDVEERFKKIAYPREKILFIDEIINNVYDFSFS